jgi:hypothetical protein
MREFVSILVELATHSIIFSTAAVLCLLVSLYKSESRFVAEVKSFIWYLFVGLSSVFMSVAVEQQRWLESTKGLDIDPMGIDQVFIRSYFPPFIKMYVFLTIFRYLFLWVAARFGKNQVTPSSE